MKHILKLLLFFIAFNSYAQTEVEELEVKKVEKETSVTTDTKLVLWDSINSGKFKYTKINDLPIGNDGVIQSVSLLGNLLNFSGTNGAFSGAVDLSSLAGGSDNLGNHTATQDLDLDGNNLLNVAQINFNTLYGAGINDDGVSGLSLAQDASINLIAPLVSVSDDIKIGDFTISGIDGTNGQALFTDGNGNVAFGNVTFNEALQDVIDNGSTIDNSNINAINNSSIFFWQTTLGSDLFSFVNYNGIGVQDTAAGDEVVLNSDAITQTINNNSVEIKADNLTASWIHQRPNANGTYALGLTDGTTTALAGTNGVIDASGLDFGGGSSTALETSYDNTDSDLTATNVKAAIDELDGKIPSSQLPYVTVNDSTYTMLEADILASKSYLIKAYRADGITPVDTVTVTYPTIAHDGSLLVSSFANISGSSIKVIPDTDVVDYRTGTKKKYVTKIDLQGYVSISSVAQDSIWGSSKDWSIGDYIPTVPFDSGLVLNGTLDDATNIDLTVTSDWSISGGVATCTTPSSVSTDTFGDNDIRFLLSEVPTAGVNYELTFDITSTDDANRIAVETQGATNYYYPYPFTTLSNGTHTIVIQFTDDGGGVQQSFSINVSTTNPDTITLDNVSLKLQ